MKTILKKAEPEDLNDINFLLKLSKSHWGYDESFMNDFMKQFGVTEEYLKTSTVHLFFVNEKLIGFYSFSLDDINLPQLDNFFLHPNFIGYGFGRQLWQHCCASALDNNIHEFTLWADPHAEGFYLKMGCERIRLQLSPLGVDRYIPVMKYAL